MSANRSRNRHSSGFTLIELIMFIVIMGVGLAGILSVMNFTVLHSADPVVRKQMLAIAEALMEEVSAQPFTYCDTTDENATTAASATVGAGGCKTTLQGLGPGGTGQTRTGASSFNNVSDYSGLAAINPATDISGIHTYAAYSATIGIVTGDALGGGLPIAPNDATAANLNLLRISVTVTNIASGDSLLLEGYRARHSPNAVP